MGKVTFRYWEPSEERLLAALFDILYTNMSSLAPTGYTYREDYDLWLGYLRPALADPGRRILLMYSDENLIGYFQYSIEENTGFVEEVERKPQYQRTMVFYRCCQFLLKRIPEEARYLVSYVNKRNRHSVSLHEKLGMERTGENKSGSSWCYRGEIRKAALRFAGKGE